MWMEAEETTRMLTGIRTCLTLIPTSHIVEVRINE